MKKLTSTSQNNRLLSLDILRGITIAGMILVNNSAGGYAYTPLKHAHWHGLTPTDLVFPFFMFIMGVSTFMSLRKFNFALSGAAVWKVVRRTLLIFLIGMALGWFGSQLVYGLASGETIGVAATHFDTIRILGVLQRLALAYGFAALIALLVKNKQLPWVAAIILAGYYLILRFGKGFELSEESIIARIDTALLGAAHMYKRYHTEEYGIAFEPRRFN